MRDDKTLGIFNFTLPTTMVFPHLFEARKFKGKNGKENGEAKFDAMLLLAPDHTDFKTYQQRAVAVAKAKWPARDIGADFKSGEFKMPWGSGDKAADKYVKKLTDAGKKDDGKADFQRGKMFIKAASKYQPRLSIIANGKPVDLDDGSFAPHKAKFYSGTLVLAQVNLVAYDGVGETGKDGVTAYLNMVLTLNKGERIGGGAPSAAEVFKGYIGHATEEDPTAGNLDDEIPF